MLATWQQLSAEERSQLQLRLHLQALWLAPAVLAAADAALRHGLREPQAGNQHDAELSEGMAVQAMLDASRFLSWLGRSAVELQLQAVSAQAEEAGGAATTMWLAALRRQLQLHAARPEQQAAAGNMDSPGGRSAAALNLFLCRLAECCRSLAQLHWVAATALIERISDGELTRADGERALGRAAGAPTV